MQVFGAKLKAVYTPYTAVYMKYPEYTVIYRSGIHCIQSRKWAKILVLCCIIIGPKAYLFLVSYASFRTGANGLRGPK
uniref:Uncharacterized protein n=1 Tax=Solanum tuberosum TaxID=4113 RepID=M1CPN6_SOLTU